MEDLLEYVVDDPLNLITPRQQALFPFVATEMLLDAPELQAIVTGSDKYLEKLFSFLRKEERNPTSAAYFSAVAQGLLARNATAVAQFLFVNNDYKRDLVRCADCRAVCDFLWKLLCCDPGLTHFPYVKISLIQSLCDSLTSEASDIAISNIGRVLQDLINARELKGWKVFIAVTLERAGEWCETLKQPQCEGLVCTLLRLLSSLLSQPDFATLSHLDISEVYTSLQRLSMPSPLPAPPLIPSILSTFPQLHTYLQASAPSGLRCSLIMDLMRGLIGWEFEVEEALISAGLIDAAVELFATQLWSSLIHMSFERLIQSICDTGFHHLQSYLINTAKLPWTLAQIASEPYVQPCKYKLRKGNLGHVIRIGNYLKECWGLRTHMSDLEDQPWWRNFVESFLEERNKLETGRLGDETARSPSPPPSATFTDQLTTALQAEQQHSTLEESLEDCEEDTAKQFRPVEYWKLPVERLQELADLE